MNAPSLPDDEDIIFTHTRLPIVICSRRFSKAEETVELSAYVACRTHDLGILKDAFLQFVNNLKLAICTSAAV
jgi:hypothetical protein